jgi:hypothetical protein
LILFNFLLLNKIWDVTKSISTLESKKYVLEIHQNYVLKF